MTNFIHPDEIRAAFSDAMSAMYRAEVPLYGDLLEIVSSSNHQVLEANPVLYAELDAHGELDRLSAERHGAIRVGTPQELRLMRRLFAVMGMAPVGYYDLAVAGLPVHSTAFRPTEPDALVRCAFRIFCSLLRVELISDQALREQATNILARRCIVSKDALAFITKFERNGGLAAGDAEAFIIAILDTFRWQGEALVDHATYQAFHSAHGLIADIVCFRGPHINHLTPRALDIDAVQAHMIAKGIKAKAVIEGPPRRAVPILLRQTSFHALEEPIVFPSDTGLVVGAHTARFGEVEQRGIALTSRGLALYDDLLAEARSQHNAGDDYQAALQAAFVRFPDDLATLCEQGLIHVRPGETMTPIIYEDFLPVSAAGIFRSNLVETQETSASIRSDRSEFERALGVPCADPLALYKRKENSARRRAR